MRSAALLALRIHRVGKANQPFEPFRSEVLLRPHRSTTRRTGRSRHACTTEGWRSKNGTDMCLEIPRGVDARTSITLLSAPSSGVARNRTLGSMLRAPLDASSRLVDVEDRVELATRPSTGRSGIVWMETHSCRSELRLIPLFPAGQTMPSSRHEVAQDRLRQVPALTARVHLAGSSHDLSQSVGFAVLSSSHAFADVCEQLEVAPLAGLQGIALKVRDHRVQEEGETSHLPLEGPVAAIRPERAAGEVPLDCQQHLTAITVLADRQARSDLPSDAERRAG